MAKELNVSDPLGPSNMKQWIITHLTENFGMQDVPFNELMADWSDLTVNEAKEKALTDVRIGHMLKETEEDQQFSDVLLEDFMEHIEETRRGGVSDQQIKNALRKANLDLERPTSEGLQAALKEVNRLQQEILQLREAKQKKTETDNKGKPERADRPEPTTPIFNEANEAYLYDTYKTIISNKFKRECCLPREVERFERKMEMINRVRPILKLHQALAMIKEEARVVAAISQEGRIIIRRGIVREEELMQKSLDEGLNPQEEQELDSFIGSRTRYREEEIVYDPPTIKVIADSGPLNISYPWEAGGYWEWKAAETEAQRLTDRGFIVRIEKV